MNEDSKRKGARDLAREYVERNDPTGWFEPLYQAARANALTIPWADLRPNPNAFDWVRKTGLSGAGKTALKVGCGLGDDAEALAALGFAVTAFDVSATAVGWARERFPDSKVNYVVADVLSPPADWRAAFDFVLEAYTLQVLPADVRRRALENIAQFVAPGGALLLVCRAREPADASGQMP